MEAAPAPDPTFGNAGVVTLPFKGMGGAARRVLVQADGRIVATGDYIDGYSPGLTHIGRAITVVARFNADGVIDSSFGAAGFVDAPIFPDDHADLAPQRIQRDGKLVGRAVDGLARYDSDGSVDRGFSTHGAAGIPWFPLMTACILATQPDGRILVAGTVGEGTAVVVILRFNADGSLDPTFNGVGAAITPHDISTNDQLAGMVLEPDGKIVLAMVSDVPANRLLTLVRYNADGSLDTTLGGAGRTLTPVNAVPYGTRVIATPDGELLVAVARIGTFAVPFLALSKVDRDGKVDATFGSGGAATVQLGPGGAYAEIDATSMQPDGRALFALSDPQALSPPRIMRLNVDGSLDATFGDAGTVVVPSMYVIDDMTLTPDGDLILAGKSPDDEFAIARYASGAVAAIEFRNAATDHYFVSVNPQEIADLDLGVHPGWSRTGASFLVHGRDLEPGTQAVCRFYIPPEHGDSHFFSADAAECGAVAARVGADPNYSGYIYETPDAFFVGLPDRSSGACPVGTVPVYRLWNHRADSNHRYTTDASTRDAMIARGYVAEGYGPDPVAMCAAAQ